jgi:hypothetical protein
MKTIIVRWAPEEGFYGKAMRVVESDHERFVPGSRFDFGFMSIANDEGYTIIVLPLGLKEN